MRPIRLLAFREHHECSAGHSIDVWIRPRAPGAAIEPLRRCPTCDTLFVVTSRAPEPALRRPSLEHDDDCCPNCRTPFAQTHPYPTIPRCPECADRISAWLTEGPDLPASAASVLRCWAVSPAAVDLRRSEPATIRVPETRAHAEVQKV